MRFRIGHDLAAISDRLEVAGDEIAEACTLGAGNLDDAVDRRRKGRIRNEICNVIGGDRLQKARRQTCRVAYGSRLGDAAEEFHELRRVDDRIGNAGIPDDLFLSDLGAHVTALGQAIGTDNGKRDVMLYAGGLFRRRQIAARCLKEFEYGLVLEGRRVCQVDNDGGSGERLGETFTRDRVDAGVRSGGNDFMALLAKALGRL
ncbi:hypothetical protein D3C80_709780 [compost metagenome]